MLSKNKVKFIKSLRLKKFRQKYNNFIVEGDKMVRELLAEAPHNVAELYALDDWLASVEEVGEVNRERLVSVTPEELKRISSLNTPNQVLAVSLIPEARVDPDKLPQALSLYLDGIQDPGNFGTILRIADWFGLSYVFSSPDCVDAYNPKAVQASMGALFRVVSIETGLEALCRGRPGLPVYGAVMDGENVFHAPLGQKGGIIVIGSEGSGISPAVEPYLSHRISIPPAAHSRADSLNAAVAAGILCAVFRERAGR